MRDGTFEKVEKALGSLHIRPLKAWVCGSWSVCQLSHPFAFFGAADELLAIQNGEAMNRAQEHVPVDPASSTSIQIPHDVVRIAFTKAPIAFSDAGAGLPPVPLLVERCICGPRGKIGKITWKIAWKMWSTISPPESASYLHVSIVSGCFKLVQWISGNG